MKNPFGVYDEVASMFQRMDDYIRQGSGCSPFAAVTPEMAGDCVWGFGENGLPFSFDNKIPTLMIGVQGSGKTTGIASYTIRNNDKFKAIFIEVLKHDYRNLSRNLQNVRTFSVQLKTYRENFLQPPPGMTIHEWISIFCDIFTESLKLVIGAGVYHYLYNKGSELIRLVPGRIPNLVDLYEYIKSEDEPRFSENHTFRERILNRLSALIEDLSDTINCSEGFPIDEMQNDDCVDVYELSNKTDASSLSSDVIIQKNLRYRMSLAPEKRQKLIIFFQDEAKRGMGAHKISSRFVGNLDNLSQSMSIAREFNVSYVISDQSLDSLHPNLPDFCSSFVLFRANAQTIFKMANIMGLNYEQRQWLIENGLEVGECVVKSGNWPPVLVRIPHFIYEKNVTDEEIRF